MYQEETEYLKFTGPQRLDKELHTLEGILRGIAIDNIITSSEIQALLSWCERHQRVSHKSPFNEIIPLIKKSAEDGNIDNEEKENIEWLCKQYITPNKYYNYLTSNMQRLHGILAGIVADEIITSEELEGLQKWLSDHEELRTIWPFDEINSLITEIMSDGKINEQEHYVLVNFCHQFLSENTTMILDLPMDSTLLRTGVCSDMPTIEFENKLFCLTGSFDYGRKNTVAEIITEFNGRISKNVCQDLDYLVIGGKGCECWAFACYGRKVEKAMSFRKTGLSLQIVHEFDFMDAVEDLR